MKNVKSKKNLALNTSKSRGYLNTNGNSNNKSFSSEQYSEFMKLKNNGLAHNLSSVSFISSHEPRGAPFLKLKEKLSDNFRHFLNKHRFSAIMVGNSLYQGKTGNFYMQMKKNKDETSNQSNLINLNTFENPNKETIQNIQNESLNDNNIFNESFPEAESKLLFEFLIIY